ncbi:type II RES/Xre toxin-antitoxin system antitoxin [Pedobacter sp. SAFR-022]|uniref:type II RES/Xre toxin-antitoxin system antitoxin n=1 Tax=Pedobacter sp. SAFR-022 TaxID=3436861 RepID=UPI003F8132E6
MAAKKGLYNPDKLTNKKVNSKVGSSKGTTGQAVTSKSHSNQLFEVEVSYRNTSRAVSLLNSYRKAFKSPVEKLTTIKKGLEAHAISDLIEITGATQATVASILDLTEPTLRKHIKTGTELNTGLSEHILQLFQLFDKGMDTFGSLEEFKSWMSHESIGLTARPVDLLDTITGINMVMDELIRIDYGITV